MNKRNFVKLSILTGLPVFLSPMNLLGKDEIMKNVHIGPFGSCCKDLSDAMTQPPNSFFFAEENGVLFLTVGYTQTDDGPGWFDQAVIFCPFCGKKIQSKEEIAKKAQQ